MSSRGTVDLSDYMYSVVSGYYSSIAQLHVPLLCPCIFPHLQVQWPRCEQNNLQG